MAIFFIHESNVDKCRKKMTAIQNKCKKYNFSFVYNELGYELKEYETDDGYKFYTKYLKVEAEGHVQHNGWAFAAVINHKENGNVLRAGDAELSHLIPDRYFHSTPICEHCNKIRSRKDTCLVYNQEANEWKQVGKSCLKEFTDGLDAEAIGWLEDYYETAESGFSGSFGQSCSYLPVSDVITYAFECVKHFGYEKAYDVYGEPQRSTKSRVIDYWSYYNCRAWLGSRSYVEKIEDELAEVKFNKDRDSSIEQSKSAIEWIASIDTEGNAYLNNLQVIAGTEYCEFKDLGILVSITAAYRRELERREKEAAMAAERKVDESLSEYQGEVGQRISFNPKTFACIYATESMYGMSFLYKMSDSNGNIYTWFASKCVDDEDKDIESITGTIKEHSEYRGVKQTVLTRCKVTYSAKKSDEKSHLEGAFDVEEAMKVFE